MWKNKTKNNSRLIKITIKQLVFNYITNIRSYVVF